MFRYMVILIGFSTNKSLSTSFYGNYWSVYQFKQLGEKVKKSNFFLGYIFKI